MNTNAYYQPYWSSLILIIAAVLIGCQPSSQETSPHSDNGGVQTQSSHENGADAERGEEISVAVQIRFNGQESDLDLDLTCPPGATVFEATRQALENHEVAFEHVGGEGEMTFVKSIGGVANQQAAGDNWVYRVNGKLGNVGAGVREVAQGDQITWSFGSYNPGEQ